jgi:hypothetical protein
MIERQVRWFIWNNRMLIAETRLWNAGEALMPMHSGQVLATERDT